MRQTIIPDWYKSALEVNSKSLTFPKTVLQFMKLFDTEEKCLSYLATVKWAGGWICSRCGSKEYGFVNTRHLIQCKKCHYQESITKGTIMEKTRKPLQSWFYLFYLLATQRTGLSARELKRQLGFGSYQTAWTWLQKMRLATVKPDRAKLKGEVEIDETYIGVVKSKEASGRGLQKGKILVICAVECVKGKKDKIASGRIRLRKIPSASANNINNFVLDNIEKETKIRTDGWQGYYYLDSLGYRHLPETIGDPTTASVKFPRVHRVFTNLKMWLRGTHRKMSPKHAQNYLNEFVFRFNRRMITPVGFRTLVEIAMNTETKTYKKLTSNVIVYSNSANRGTPHI